MKQDYVNIGPLDPIKWFGLACFIVEQYQQDKEELRQKEGKHGGTPSR